MELRWRSFVGSYVIVGSSQSTNIVHVRVKVNSLGGNTFTYSRAIHSKASKSYGGGGIIICKIEATVISPAQQPLRADAYF